MEAARATRGPVDSSALVRGLTTLLQIEREARQARSIAELGFVMVNRGLALLPATTVVCWVRTAAGAVRVERLSGLPVIDRGTPFVAWAEDLLGGFARAGDAATVHPTPLSAQSEPAVVEEWRHWAPPEGLWCPLIAPDGRGFGGLWYAREHPWRPDDVALAGRLAETYAHAWALLVSRPRFDLVARLRSRWTLAAGLAAVAGALALPVTQSVLAPAEVVAEDALVVAAPADGVLDGIEVEPNQMVHVGDTLFRLNDTTVRSRHDVAEMELKVAQAELHKARQMAFGDAASQAALAVLQSQIDLRRAEAEAAASLLARVEVKAERDGVAIFGDPNELRGRPVQTGERVMVLADPARAELSISLPASDATVLELGARVRMFLNVAPLRPIEAALYQAGYDAAPGPDGTLSYRLKARLADGVAPPRIGLKGTARISGGETSLFFYVMRRPLAALRRTVGL